jgi:hypothetical protein
LIVQVLGALSAFARVAPDCRPVGAEVEEDVGAILEVDYPLARGEYEWGGVHGIGHAQLVAVSGQSLVRRRICHHVTFALLMRVTVQECIVGNSCEEHAD